MVPQHRPPAHGHAHGAGQGSDGSCLLQALMQAIAPAPGASESGRVLEDALRRALGADDVQVLSERAGDPADGDDDRWHALERRGRRLGWMRVRGGGAAAAHTEGAVLAAALALEQRGRQMEAVSDGGERLTGSVARVATAAAGERDRGAVASVLVAEAAHVEGVTAAALLLRSTPRTTPATVAVTGVVRPGWPAGLAAMASGRTQASFPGQVGVPLVDAHGVARGALVAAYTGSLGADALERLTVLARCASLACAHVDLRRELDSEQARRGELAAALVDAQERERRRVAEDLHDGPVQELSGLALMLDALGGELALRDGDADAVARAAAAARQAIASMRRAIHDLHPLGVHDRGFSVAVRNALDRLGHRGMTVELVGMDVADQLPRDTRAAAFRVVREAVANAVRHSQAQTLRVEGRRVLDDVVLEVVDDGVGFDPESTPKRTGDRRTHLGLVVLRERAMLCGGDVVVTSRPGNGTRVQVRFPVTGEARAF